ncbi:hypothetical protein ACIA58_19725 [Kribbella sp. NPDC051586]|uniref:hypothetical protein n=1 Tax=Kribbella sp. NPDC051586 TaxID=3364118 RepID=UPI00378E690F
MVGDALVTLAAAGGAAVVGAMATDAWRATRDGVARLFGRRGKKERDAVLAELERDADRLADADVNDHETLQRELVERWRDRLSELLGAEPEAADELKELLAQSTLAQPTFVQHIVARGNGRAFGVQGGDLHYHEHPADSDEAG